MVTQTFLTATTFIKLFKDQTLVVVELKTRQNVDLLEIINNNNVIILDV